MPWEALTTCTGMGFQRRHPDTGFFKMYMTNIAAGVGFVRQGAQAEDIVAERAKRPMFDEFWASKRPDLSKITAPPTSVQAGRRRDCIVVEASRATKQISSKEKWLEVHGRKEWETYYSRECLERQRRFFDHFLKGRKSGIKEFPRVRFEVRERFYEGRTRFAEDYPIPGTQYRALFLDAKAGSIAEQCPGNEASVRYSAVKSTQARDRAEFSFTSRSAPSCRQHKAETLGKR